jgi:hypothetical protein
MGLYCNGQTRRATKALRLGDALRAFGRKDGDTGYIFNESYDILTSVSARSSCCLTVSQSHARLTTTDVQ